MQLLCSTCAETTGDYAMRKRLCVQVALIYVRKYHGNTLCVAQNPPCVRIRAPWQVRIVIIKLIVSSLNFQIPRKFIPRNLLCD